MNLNDFIKYKEICPCCDNKLSLSFLKSRKKQKIRYEEEAVKVSIELYGTSNWDKRYDVNYYINIYNNEFYISFGENDSFNNKYSNFKSYVPIDVLNNFRKFQDYSGNFAIFKDCTKCHNYSYTSSETILNFKNSKIENISIENELVCFIQPYESKYKKIIIHNRYSENISVITSSLTDDDSGILNKNMSNVISTPLIDLNFPKDKIISKLEKMFLFA